MPNNRILITELVWTFPDFREAAQGQMQAPVKLPGSELSNKRQEFAMGISLPG
jgi:hypothetical protein